MNLYACYFLFFGLLKFTAAANTLKFAHYYNSHMVLQKAPQRAVLWGYATTIGDSVSVALNGSIVANARVTNNTEGAGGIWMTKLPAQNAGGPYTIAVTSQDGHVTLTDVMFGDVWVCSGQSNMAFTMARVFNHSQELIESSHFHNIRILKVRPTESATTRQDVTLSINWKMPGNDRLTSYFSAVCLLYAMELSPHINRPIGLIESDWGGTPVEAWSSPDARSACGHRQKRNPRNNHVLWNAMIHPLLPYTIYGAIWYQGEANSRHADDYACTFPAMIDDWRQKFHQKSMGETSSKFPFGFVQLSALSNNTQLVGGFPGLRWAQTAKYGYVPNNRLQNVFMAVAMDLPDFNSPYGAIHPRDKLDVAHRLALAGRAVAYNETNISYQGPLPTSVHAQQGSLVIQFDHGTKPIEVRDTQHGFEVCCASTPTADCSHLYWSPAQILSHSSASVTLKTTICHGTRNQVAGVRYAWHSSPCQFKKCAIYGRDTDLPAPPFIKTGPF